MGGHVHADTINTGNPDIEMRWDNTVRYNGGWRAEGRNPAFYNNPGFDETEGRFKRGEMVTNRVDLLSELDFTYQGKYGFRVSGAAWADGAYGNNSLTNPALPAASNYRNGQYNDYTKRYIVGPSGEILDAFIFGGFNLGETTLNVKLGQHNVYWGESLFSLGNSIAYSQGPVDTIKAATSPGVEAKETFLPQKQVSAQAQLSNEVSIGAHYAFEWNPYRLVPGGTYFGTGDATRSDFATTTPIVIPNGGDIRPRNSGDFGVNLRWSPEWLNGTAGFYYRKFDEKLPWGVTQLRALPVAPFAAPSAIRLAFARDTELYGLSLSKNLSSLSVGTEISYRRNTALNSTISVLPANRIDPTYEEIEGARGNTFHALANAIYLLPETPLWRGGSLNAELNYSRLLSVTRNAQRFNAIGYACPAGRGKVDGCSTKDAWGMNISFTPSWPQAFPGWDISMPTTLAYQIKGNGSALGGGNEGAVAWSIGIAGTLYSRYDFALRYVDARAQHNTNAAGVATTTNGNAVQNDHGWVSFTFKTTF
ncbi:DUF1302 family protein [Noviherbaspirillum saxi]|uniref:DUF1302 family protein n=2 Tax=Noviherbaspirillum saxi TaxID=2320863 RepID=A0A3A3G097_9BURK|nr:DUF1302 family protein [Noviherbaspirillum saxi]